MFCLFRLLVWLIAVSSTGSDAATASIIYGVVNAASLLPGVPQRLVNQGWESVPNSLSCTRKSRQTFPNTKGFLYNTSTGLCTPLQWLEEQTADGATGLQDEEGQIYMDQYISCAGDFQLYEYGPDGLLACLHLSKDLMTFTDASAACTSVEGFLVSVKTSDKLNFVGFFANDNFMWVGLDDMEQEGVFIWHDDGETMSTEEQVALFASGEPNNSGDCVHYYPSGGRLDDTKCEYPKTFLCETDLPAK